jgi:hypothetical protein
MSNEYLEKLKTARESLVKQRRSVVNSLDLGQVVISTATSEQLVNIQAAIRAIDEAIKDEEKLSSAREPIAIDPSERIADDDDPESSSRSILTL